MLVEELLLCTLEDLVDDDFQTFKWYLTKNMLDPHKPIPKCRLDRATRTDTVDHLISSYGEESAVNVTVEILKMMKMNNAAVTLKDKHSRREGAAERRTALSPCYTFASAPPAGGMFAQQGAVIIAPQLGGRSTIGSWSVNITHK